MPQVPNDGHGPQPHPPTASAQLPTITGAPGNANLPRVAGPIPGEPIARSEGEGVDFIAFCHSIRRRWLVSVGVGLMLAALAATLLWIFVPVRIEAETLLRAQRSQPSIVGKSRTESDKEFEVYKQTQVSLIKSPFVLGAALSQPGVHELEMVRNENEPLAWLEDEIRVSFIGDSEILRIGLRGEDEDETKQIVKAVQDAFMDEVVFAERKEALVRSDILKRNYRQNVTSIKEKTDELFKLQEQLGTSDSRLAQMNEEFALEELASLRRNIDRKRLQLDEVNRQLVLLVQTQGAAEYEPSVALIENEMSRDRRYAELKDAVAQLEAQIQYYTGGAVRSVPGLEQMKTELAFMKSQIRRLQKEMTPGVVERLRLVAGQHPESSQHDIQSLQINQRILMQQLAEDENRFIEKEGEVRAMGGRSADLVARSEELASLQATTNQLRLEIDALELNLQREPRIQVVQPPIVPELGSFRWKVLQVVLAAGMVLALSVLGIAAWDYQTKRLNSRKHLVDSGALRVLGAVPALSRPGTVTGVLEDAVGSIRASLMYHRDKDPIHAVLVTSALGQEGKTTVASQLAVSLAKAGRNTLLVDGDIRNPQQHNVFGLPMDSGLCELLRGEATIEHVVQATQQDQLSLLPAGRYDDSAMRAMSNSALASTLNTDDRFDFVVVDAGPVLTGPEALLLGQHADAAVLSVRQDVSRMPKIVEACDRLRSVGIRIIGSVVNGGSPDIRRKEKPANS